MGKRITIDKLDVYYRVHTWAAQDGAGVTLSLPTKLDPDHVGYCAVATKQPTAPCPNNVKDDCLPLSDQTRPGRPHDVNEVNDYSDGYSVWVWFTAGAVLPVIVEIEIKTKGPKSRSASQSARRAPRRTTDSGRTDDEGVR